MTADRVPSLHRLAASWAHLLSIAYLADDYQADAARGLRLIHLDGAPPPYEEKITLSVVEDRGYRLPNAGRFPFNLLRNVAVSAAPSDFVCLVDVDFVIHPLRPPNTPAAAAPPEGARSATPPCASAGGSRSSAPRRTPRSCCRP